MRGRSPNDKRPFKFAFAGMQNGRKDTDINTKPPFTLRYPPHCHQCSENGIFHMMHLVLFLVVLVLRTFLSNQKLGKKTRSESSCSFRTVLGTRNPGKHEAQGSSALFWAQGIQASMRRRVHLKVTFAILKYEE